MKKIYWLSLTIILCSFTGKNLTFIADNVQYFEKDNLGQIFVVQQDNSVSKYSVNGDLLITKNLKVQGDLSYIDVKNSFEYLFFYQSINMLLATDNLFNQRAMLNFNDNEFLASKQIVAVHRSFDNQIWAFDVVTQRLLKINLQGKVLFESSSLPSQNGNHNVKWIIEAVPNVFLIDSNELTVLNIYGKMIQSKDLSANVTQPYLINDTLVLETGLGIYNCLKNGDVFELKSRPIKNTLQDNLFLRADSLFLRTN